MFFSAILFVEFSYATVSKSLKVAVADPLYQEADSNNSNDHKVHCVVDLCNVRKIRVRKVFKINGCLTLSVYTMNGVHIWQGFNRQKKM